VREEGILDPGERDQRGTGKKPCRPSRPNELCQKDLRYVKVAGRRYFLLVFVDVYSRFVPYWELLRSMDGETVSLAAFTALETLPEKDRRGVTIQSDNGNAFMSGDFARVLQEDGVGQARIHPSTLEQNAFVERGSPPRESHGTKTNSPPSTRPRAPGPRSWTGRTTTGSTAGSGTSPPVAMHSGEADRFHEERRAKLAQARHRRKEDNLNLRQPSSEEPNKPGGFPLSSCVAGVSEVWWPCEPV